MNTVITVYGQHDLDAIFAWIDQYAPSYITITGMMNSIYDTITHFHFGDEQEAMMFSLRWMGTTSTA